MPRRSSKKAEVLEIGSIETIVTPKKEQAVKVEATELITKIEKSYQAKSKTKIKPKEHIASDDEPLVTPKKSPSKLKINRVKAKAVLEEQAPKQTKAPAKRKIGEDEKDADEKKAPKKRKTKEEKEAEAMPLAARTLVATLKKAMHIGAHVSGAGGE